MRRFQTAWTPFAVSFLLLASCSKQPDDSARRTERVTTADVQEEIAPPAAPGMSNDTAGPGISPRAAPGVAFNYRYAFLLPDEAIAAVQERHAAACEKLGPTQCRITGMRYTLVDEDRVTAHLEMKLAPELARGFGKDGIAAVQQAKGKLVDAAIFGQDVASQITASQRQTAELQAELQRIEARIAAAGTSSGERADLQAQAERIRQQLSAERQSRNAGEDMLATTPMMFTYSGAEGFTLGADPIGDSAGSAWRSFVTMISVVLMAIGIALPWLLLLVALLLIARSRPGRWLREKAWPARKGPDPQSPATDEA